MASRDPLHYPEEDRQFLEKYLPVRNQSKSDGLPFVTLTFATSLDSALSLAPGTQTALSGPQSKAMTHYLRSRHDAILVGVGTAVADNPSLNCRSEGVGGYGGEGLEGQPRPIVVDPHGRWQLGQNTKILNLAKEGRGKAPWVFTAERPKLPTLSALQRLGGTVFQLEPKEEGGSMLNWEEILRTVRETGIESVMIEGGGAVINSLLAPENAHLIDSVIITIAPTWLGQGGVSVSPPRPATETAQPSPVARLKDTTWRQLGPDGILCGYLN
ncbi:2,5-diamino-6-(ribosylamino)-4(3H)-pyrimidinone 5'-phosphate reductase [Zalaria obscura]|uniref:2,5-diamino-6-(Ribosylamino)-4(3H)-pyrimidinone 5'-phosphate reductase n=1 Tax=Zalaria obscura TaxID=2024903 RepID=A0ACC3S6I0_9PEZI